MSICAFQLFIIIQISIKKNPEMYFCNIRQREGEIKWQFQDRTTTILKREEVECEKTELRGTKNIKTREIYGTDYVSSSFTKQSRNGSVEKVFPFFDNST
jgi:hypothetical protein